MGATIKGPDGKLRCKWCDAAPSSPSARTSAPRFTQRDVNRLISDHVAGCVIRVKVERARKSFKRPCGDKRGCK